jgi:hypothetical protein
MGTEPVLKHAGCTHTLWDRLFPTVWSGFKSVAVITSSFSGSFYMWINLKQFSAPDIPVCLIENRVAHISQWVVVTARSQSFNTLMEGLFLRECMECK